ncbi:MAG: hypothetical protein P8J87_20625, partial [Verrucomicrobiales bacterium]|nr:hypothetical protein [Verrucomicrobiales bacterium]
MSLPKIIATSVIGTSLLASSHAAITGQWDFDQGDLRATIGQEMDYQDGPGEETETGTEFGSTTDFGIPGIQSGGTNTAPLRIVDVSSSDGGASYVITWTGGDGDFTVQRKTSLSDPTWVDVDITDERNYTAVASESSSFFRILGTAAPGGEVAAQVMKFPKISEENFLGGYVVPCGANANGDDIAFLVNEYTLIMDVLFPEESSGKRRAIFDSNFGGNAEFFIGENNGIGSSSEVGQIAPNTWHRIAIAVNQGTNTITKYIDGAFVGEESISGGLDGRWGIDPFLFALFNDDDGESELGYINSLQFRDEILPSGLIELLGGPSAEGILVGDPPNPYIVAASPDPSTARFPGRSKIGSLPEIKIIIQDGESLADLDSIELLFGPVGANGTADLSPVTPTVTHDAGQTTITYTPPTPLEPLSVHQVVLSYQDNGLPPTSLGSVFRFGVGPFISVPTDIAGSTGSGSEPGFTVRSAQAPETIILQPRIGRAIQQLNGTLEDPSNPGTAVPNEALQGPNPDGSFDADIINFEALAVWEGNFLEDVEFPGIPGTGGHTNQFATEVLTYLELSAGFHQFGAQVWVERTDAAGGGDDDGFTLFTGTNPKDIFSTVIHSFERSADAPAFQATTDDNLFNFVAPTDGVYPFRLVYYQKSGGAALEWYSVDTETDEKILINDSTDPRSVKAFRSSSAAIHDGAYVAEVSPTPDAQGVSADTAVAILLIDDATQVNQASVQLFLNDVDVTAQSSIQKTGASTTVTYQPNQNRPDEANALRLVFLDNLGAENSREWQFTSKVETGSGTNATGLWNFGSGLAADIGQDLEFFGGDGSPAQVNTVFDNTDNLPIDGIDGQPVDVMVVPYIRSNELGY